LGFDRSVAQFRRLMTKLMEAEAAAGGSVTAGQPSVAAE